MRGHVVAVVPELDALGEVDALAQPVLGPRVLDEDRGRRPDHPVAAGRLGLEVAGTARRNRLLEERPALVHPPGEDVGTTPSVVAALRSVAASSAARAAIRRASSGVADPLVEAPVEHVGGGEPARAAGPARGRTPRSVGAPCIDRRTRDDLAERRPKGIGPRLEAIAEEVPDGDERPDDRGRREGVAGLEVARPGRRERVVGGLRCRPWPRRSSRTPRAAGRARRRQVRRRRPDRARRTARGPRRARRSPLPSRPRAGRAAWASRAAAGPLVVEREERVGPDVRAGSRVGRAPVAAAAARQRGCGRRSRRRSGRAGSRSGHGVRAGSSTKWSASSSSGCDSRSERHVEDGRAAGRGRTPGR